MNSTFFVGMIKVVLFDMTSARGTHMFYGNLGLYSSATMVFSGWKHLFDNVMDIGLLNYDVMESTLF